MHHNPYSDLVKELRLITPEDAEFGRRLNELIAINELLTTLNQAGTLEQRLEILLFTVLGQYGCHKGVVYIKSSDAWAIGKAKGMRSAAISADQLPNGHSWDELPNVVESACEDPDLARLFEIGEFELLLPARNEGKLVGLICLGKSRLGKRRESKIDMLRIIADFSGVIIGNSLFHHDLQEMNKELQRQLFKLRTLYELTGAFAHCFENEAVFQLLANNLMGQFFISRCAVIAFDQYPTVVFRKGLKLTCEVLPQPELSHELDTWPRAVQLQREVACPTVATFMKQQNLRYALPVASASRIFCLLLLGERLDRRELSTEDLDFIRSLAEQAAAALENVELQKQMLEKKRMEKELQLARDIQQRLIPKRVPQIPGYELAAEMRPFDTVGGDFYDFIQLEDGRLIVCLADVSGKSLPASMIMSTAQASLRALTSFSGLGPREVIERLNLHMYQSTSSNRFITMFYAVLDPSTHTLDYINCGHNQPILHYPDHSTQMLALGGMVLGMFPKAQFQVGQVVFEPGAELLIYTDGLSEVTSPDGEEFGEERLINCLVKPRGLCCLEEDKNNIIKEVMAFSQNEMVDDMTLLLIRRKPE